MNERIKELAEQAGVYFGEATKDYFGEEHPAFVSIRDMDVEKFAELIVKECMGLVDGYTYPVQTQSHTIYHIASETIKHHFGVEE